MGSWKRVISFPIDRPKSSADQLLTFLSRGYCYEYGLSISEMVILTFDFRAALTLTPTCVNDHLPLKKRVADARRIIRNIPPARECSFRINTDFEACVEGFRKHVHRSWIEPNVVELLRELLRRKELTVFELWHNDQMIAADVGHANKGCMYISSRWHDSSYSAIGPGFLLALAQQKLLRDHRYTLWDVGGVAPKEPHIHTRYEFIPNDGPKVSVQEEIVEVEKKFAAVSEWKLSFSPRLTNRAYSNLLRDATRARVRPLKSGIILPNLEPDDLLH